LVPSFFIFPILQEKKDAPFILRSFFIWYYEGIRNEQEVFNQQKREQEKERRSSSVHLRSGRVKAQARSH
jgi:hypothetical protein